MEKNNSIKKDAYSSFFNLIRKQDIDESTFVDWMDELQKDLSSFWEKMND